MEGETRLQVASKERLKQNVSKKMKNIMIGCLSLIEVICDDEKRFKMLRSKVLRLGNDEIRNFEQELGRYIVELEQYEYQIPVRERGN